ncbi:MAG: RHS repeat-associated core domain-containing protein [bacterium]
MKNEGNIDFRVTTTNHRSSSGVEMTLRERFPIFQRGLGGFSSNFHILDRGYCGHEHLLEHNIINMNGRIYDPITAQFMQADNYIQSPEDFISYNRYSYCLFNPFKYTDPSGEEPYDNVNAGFEVGHVFSTDVGDVSSANPPTADGVSNPPAQTGGSCSGGGGGTPIAQPTTTGGDGTQKLSRPSTEYGKENRQETVPCQMLDLSSWGNGGGFPGEHGGGGGVYHGFQGVGGNYDQDVNNFYSTNSSSQSFEVSYNGARIGYIYVNTYASGTDINPSDRKIYPFFQSGVNIQLDFVYTARSSSGEASFRNLHWIQTIHTNVSLHPNGDSYYLDPVPGTTYYDNFPYYFEINQDNSRHQVNNNYYLYSFVDVPRRTIWSFRRKDNSMDPRNSIYWQAELSLVDSSSGIDVPIITFTYGFTIFGTNTYPNGLRVVQPSKNHLKFFRK